MSEAHHRKKQPERVRQQLLDVAARLSSENGIAGITLDAVSHAAGVSKGGLLHHFPNRMALLNGLFDDLTARFDAAISEAMRIDPVAQGRFTRAYIATVFAIDAGIDTPVPDRPGPETQGWRVLTIALLAEPSLRARWRRWVDNKADEFVGTDSSAGCLLARFAADGLWLAELLQSHDVDARTRKMLQVQLKALSVQ